MTVWTSLNEKSKYGVALHNFVPRPDSSGLSIHVGELLEIVCESEEWYYGKRVAGRREEAKGIVPKGYVRLRDCSVDRTGSVEIVSIVQPQIVQEITQTLRSWSHHWKHLYVTGGAQFKFIEVSMRALLELRSAILSGTLPNDQLKKVQKTAIYTMDKGNRKLDMDLTVRCTSTGVQVDPRNISTCQLYTFHEETAKSIEQKNEDSNNSPSAQSPNSSYSFFASVRNFVCKMSEDAELLMSLYDGGEHRHFTESYVVRWSKGGLASDIDQLHNLRVLFTDLGTSDIKREKVYLVCYVVRVGGMEPQNIDNRRSSVAAALASGRSVSQSGGSVGSGMEHWGRGSGMRRPHGVAAMDITHFLSGQLDMDDDKHHCVTFFPCEKDNNLDTLLRRIISNKDLKGDPKTGQGLWLSVKLFRGDLKQIREEVPHLMVGNLSIARKMGFPEVILPGDARNDLYLCLVQGCFTRGTGKSTDRNIQVTTRVCNQHGQMIPGVISLGGGVQPLNEYNSVVYYHEDKPRWLETFKICVPIEEFKQAHVVFLFKHRSSNDVKDKAEKPFALAYTQLMQPNGTTLNDTQHCLNVYKVDGKKWPNNDIDAAMCYLSLPSQRNISAGDKENNKLQRGFLSLSPKDSFLIRTNVCSTKLTQNVELLGVLNWRDHITDDSLRHSLTTLQTVPGGEVVKFMQDILDALFSILDNQERGVDSEMDQHGSYNFLVFECLLTLISLVSDRKFHHFQPVLDLYIKKSFCATLAYEKLCMLLSQLVCDAGKADSDNILLRTMKCLEYLVRFIVKSRELHSVMMQGRDQHDFQQLFQELLDSIVIMMRCDSKSALTSQGACIKYLPSSVQHIIQVFPEEQLATMIGEIFDVLPLDRLTKQRLIAILDLIQGPLFLSSKCRCILLPHITSNLKTLIKNNDETSRCGVEIRSKNRSVDKIARVLGASRHKLQEHRGYSEQLELCVKILSEILALLFRNDVGPTDEEFNHLTSSLLRTIIQATIQMDRENPLVCQLVSVLLEMLRQMNLERYNQYLSRFSCSGDLLDFLMEIQLVLRDLVEKPVFHAHWADMINLQYYIVLNTFRLFSSTLTEHFYENFELQVWSNWFHLAVGFLTRPSLQLERRLPEQRRRITAQFGDMRRDAARQIHSMWFNLGQHKIQFVPTLVGPFLEMSLIPEIELRKATIPLFFDMMQCEFTSPRYPADSFVESLRDLTHIKGNFNDFENEMIHKLDVLVEGGSGDAEWSSLFVSIVGELCAGHATLRDTGGHFVRVVGQLLDTLLQYRALHDHSSMDYRMQATTTLLDFYSDIKRPEMYIRYVNKLCELHLECENWTEAGLTQRLHAKLLQWSSAPLSTLLRSRHGHSHCQTHRDLKEALYYDIIHYMDKGKMWELAVGVCKELVTQYEEEVFDYCHLSELYQMMSGFYAAIVKQPRPQPEYFRVGYYGKGFPPFLQNKVFVYKGKDYERLQDFSARTLNGLPNAELMSTLSPPGEDIKNSNQQSFIYKNTDVQINAVEPVMSEHNRMSGKPISDRIMKFHQHNNVNKFRYSRPFHRNDESMAADEKGNQNEFATLWLERTELEIREKLPAILRWCPVVKSVTHEMSPLQVAVETMKTTNSVLRSLVIEHRADHTLALDPLTRKLNGVVDAAVMGGIANYEKVFFTEEYLRAHPEHRGLINTLKDLIASQIPLLEFGIDVHRVRLPPSLAPLHQRIQECFDKMKTHVHEKYGKKNCDLEKEISMVTMRRQMSILSTRGMSFAESSPDNRWSEISNQTNHSVESGISMGRTQANSLKAFTSQFNKQVHRGSLGSGITSGYASLGMPTTRKRDKDRRRGRKSEVAPAPLTSAPSTPSGATSQWYTGPAPPLSMPNGNTKGLSALDNLCTASTIVELRQELTPSRPLRSEVEKERRLSQRPQSLQSGTNSNRNSAGTTDSNISNEDDPPPLPQKTVRTDHNASFNHNLPPASSESCYQAINFMVSSPSVKSPSGSHNSSRSAVTSPVMLRQDYDQVFTPRDSALYKSLQPATAHALRKNLNSMKERAPTPPPKKRLNSVQN